MNIEQLEAIHAIIEKGSFRAASDFLKRSQPALSTCIKNLEEELNLEIFDRSSYRPTLTPRGKAIFDASKKVLEASRHFMRIGMELGKMKIETELRLAVDPLAPLEAIELIAKECARPAYPVNLVMSKAVLQSGANDLSSGKVDLALAAYPAEIKSEIEVIRVKSTTLITAVSKKLFSKKKQKDADFLSSHAQILIYDKQFDQPDPLLPNPMHQGGGPKIYAPDHFTKLEMIKMGLGWGRISEDELKTNSALVELRPEQLKTKKLELCLMRPKSRPLGPIGQKIWQVFADTFGEVQTHTKAISKKRMHHKMNGAQGRN